jgi:small-conductance mechanosensitive channel
MMYQWVVFFHILGALMFFMAHGASMAMAFQLWREHEPARIRAMLDLSRATVPGAYIALLVLLVAGIIAGIMGNWFTKGWIWTALVLLVVLMGLMYAYSYRFYTPIRKAIGLPYSDRQGEHAAETPASESDIAAAIQAANPAPLMGGSFLLIAIILWLMIFKPF